MKKKMRYLQSQNIISTVGKLEIKNLDQCFGYYDLENQSCLQCLDSLRCRRTIFLIDDEVEKKECFGDWQGSTKCLFCQSQPFCRFKEWEEKNDYSKKEMDL